jgi:hypothetical protein
MQQLSLLGLLFDPENTVEPFLGNGSVNTFPRQRILSKAAAVHKGIEHASRGIATLRSRHQEMSSEDSTGWKRLSTC